MIAEISSQKLDPASSSLHAHGYHLENRRLPGPAWSKYPHDLILRDREADSTDLLLSYYLSPFPRIRVVIGRIGLSDPLDDDLLTLCRRWSRQRERIRCQIIGVQETFLHGCRRECPRLLLPMFGGDCVKFEELEKGSVL